MNSTSPYETRSLSAVLAAELLEAGHDLRVRVSGNSMRPFLKDGDVVTIRKTPLAALKKGDILFCRCDNDVLILHRLLKTQNDGSAPDGMLFYIKGDALDRMDSPVAAGQCLGKVVTAERRAPRGVVLTDMLSSRSVITNCLSARYFRFRVVMVGCLAALRRSLVG
jgi:translation initiation factor IF-1